MNKASRPLVTRVILATAVAMASGVAYSQVAIRPQPITPKVFAGEDIGFRMTARKGDTPVGQLVVKVDGEWKEVEFSYAMKQVTK